MLKKCVPVTTASGVEIEVTRNQPAHAIILIPEMDLIQDRAALGQSMIKSFMRETGSYIHVLDVSELLRIVQAAEMISSRSEKVTAMMAFDGCLIERAKRADKAGTLCIEILHGFADDSIPIEPS